MLTDPVHHLLQVILYSSVSILQDSVRVIVVLNAVPDVVDQYSLVSEFGNIVSLTFILVILDNVVHDFIQIFH